MKQEYTTNELVVMMEECFLYDSSFEYVYCYDMDSIEDLLSGADVVSVMNMVHFGEYNPSCEYFRFDGYGNIESVYESDYLEEVEDMAEEIVERASELGVI